ncbi:hypothetical protein VSX64_16365 [Aurantimonas sp. C2-6-R+9]|uniref:hypothetical protein n=1 Tax=unclassified Aurantimonas TaxID=2638230 RepID=UPI002E17311D|nr:hypothetical protein [Aurantimonas sp. C2-6-R+9]
MDEQDAATSWHDCIGGARTRYHAFIDRCRAGSADYRLTPRAEPTSYARCFAVFGLHLIGARAALHGSRDDLVPALRRDLRAARGKPCGPVPRDKAYRQLLCFTLSALATLGALDDDPLLDLVKEQVPDDAGAALAEAGALEGRAQSGNQAMFLAIFLLHLRRFAGRDTRPALGRWVETHSAAMNRFGFWGPDAGLTHLHFQNGYHQYEIFELLGAKNPREAEAITAVASLCDPLGHFAPYPGGGGCFDYDAVFVLTPDGRAADRSDVRGLLARTRDTIVSEQLQDGGFCESLRVRPRMRSWPGFAERLASGRNLALFKERARYALTLQRPKHDRIHTHWSRYSRGWDEANLWDSWFRILTIARIECAFDPPRAGDWGFIDYPGIGWHPSLRTGSGWA